MNYLYLEFQVEEKIAVITISREKVLNALNNDVIDELRKAFEEVERRADIGCAILTGAGRAFVAGADIAGMSAMNGTEGRATAIRGQKVFEYIENLPKPVIAAVNGFALGGGCELAMSCDIRIAAESAKFGQPEVNLGIIPGYGGTQRLPRLVGKGMAKYLCLTGEIIRAEEALRIGLVEKVVPNDDLIEEAKKVARMILAKAPIAIQYTKTAINYSANTDLVSGIAYEAEIYTSSFITEDKREGMAAFLEKRPADFKNK